jgi:hypothetical protein
MRRLDPESFDRARRFLKTTARPLDRARFEYHFEGGPPELVVSALARYQNRDGGFGHALEPDLRTPMSSALCTGIALTILRELGTNSDHPMVERAVVYLRRTWDPDSWTWRVVPAGANDSPHAPWWHDEDGSLARTFDDYLVIPRAQLVAHLNHYAKLVPGDWLAAVTEATVRDIEEIEPLGSGGGDDLRYTLTLASEPALLPRLRERLQRRLRVEVQAAVSLDPAEWDSYVITPLKAAPTPDSPVAHLVRDALHAYLDHLLDRQSSDGSWAPVWSWGDFYPDAWPQAAGEWRGELTLENVLALRAWDRIEFG